jgi:hypothetical protein
MSCHCRLCGRAGIDLPHKFVEKPIVKWAGNKGDSNCQDCYRLLLSARKLPNDKEMLALFAKSTRPALAEIKQLRLRLCRLTVNRNFNQELLSSKTKSWVRKNGRDRADSSTELADDEQTVTMKTKTATKRSKRMRKMTTATTTTTTTATTSATTTIMTTIWDQ